MRSSNAFKDLRLPLICWRSCWCVEVDGQTLVFLYWFLSAVWLLYLVILLCWRSSDVAVPFKLLVCVHCIQSVMVMRVNLNYSMKPDVLPTTSHTSFTSFGVTRWSHLAKDLNTFPPSSSSNVSLVIFNV